MLPGILSLGGFLCICFFILFLFFKLINYMSTRSIRYYQRCIEIEQKCILFERDYLACFSEKAVAEYPQLSMHLAQPSKLLSFTGSFFALFLLAQQGLLLALCLFQTGHETAFLLGFLGILAHYLAHGLFFDHVAENVGLDNGDEKREQVIVAQAGCVVVEEEQEHQRHEVVHHLHSGHGVGVGLGLHVDAHVDDVNHRHKQTEEAYVVAECG